jgi:hypothetical protein
MRYLSRNKVYEKVAINKDAKKIYIFCEGEEKEVRYFKYFQGFSSNIDIVPIPNDNGQSDPLKLKENALLLFGNNDSEYSRLKLSKEYRDEIWFVIDTDRWNEGDKIQQLRDFCKERNKEYTGWYLAQSNPCFELWLYYHLNNNKPEKTEVDDFKTFKEFVNSKIKGGFDHRTMPFEIETAIKNSISYFDTENEQPQLYSTEIHFLGKVILPFIKEQLDKCKGRMATVQHPDNHFEKHTKILRTFAKI